NFKKYEGKDQDTIDNEMDHFKPTETLKELSEALDTIKDQVDEVLDPILVIQAENDNMIDPQSANYIYDHVDSDYKNIKWYSESGHVITIDKEKEQVFEDIYPPYDGIPDEAFLIKELKVNSLAGKTGTI
ncbi:alpha/beta hydrolase, partial [Staphylococcus aureus]|uniref:alpha/beta hydrolase n=1 Tax=Staphylococcus aureus TaxID=1280 RepID=UPI00210A2343